MCEFLVVKNSTNLNSITMDDEQKEYFRGILNQLDNSCNLINESVEDDYLQDDEEYAELYDAIAELQEKITNYQEFNKYI
jgi:small nuclear ribonucleoprotein (snRNP)-like protein